MRVPAGKLTNSLVIANVVIFLVIAFLGLEQQAVLRGGFFPVRIGGELIDVSEHGWLVPAWLTPLSSAFLHSGLLHLGLNMLMLWFCGRFVEQALGAQLMAFLYLVGDYAASFAEFAFNSDSMIPVIGASGAISAVIGSYALLFARNKVEPVGPIPGHVVRIVWLTLAWVAIQLMIGLATMGNIYGIAIFAHIGGFVAGLLLTRPLLQWRFRQA